MSVRKDIKLDIDDLNYSYKLPSIINQGCTDDTWSPVQINTWPPIGRYRHVAVWTGTEMIVWGGFSNSYLNTGTRYNPSTDSWIETSTINAPSARCYIEAAWTGTDMIIWGGASSSEVTNTGAIYNPSSDSWLSITTTLAPSPRALYSMVWTGNEMIIWGGYNYSQYFNTGGRYNPALDSWIPTSTTETPTERYFHTAIWTGDEMIVWGGRNSTISYMNDGAHYCAVAPLPNLQSQEPVIDDSGSSTPNGIIETDELVNLIGNLTNTGNSIATSVTGQLTTLDPITIINANASYPDLSPSESADCSTCYTITAPANNRPALHWDFVVTETPSCSTCALQNSYDFTYHVGNSFADVPPSNLFYTYIEKLLHSGVTSGCDAINYCPSNNVQQQHMAKFICLAMEALTPGSCPTSTCNNTFDDVPTSNPFCPFIESLYQNNVVAGCQINPLKYCPTNLTNRQAMAKFICNAMKAATPGSCVTTNCASIFTDVPSSNPFCTYIEALYNANIVSGCGPSLYCPTNNVSRGQMAKFLVNAFI